jgi:hypothetical protein
VEKTRYLNSRGMFLGLLTLVSFALGIVSHVHALSIRLSDGSYTVTCADGAACDFTPQTGAVGYTGSVGSWVFNLTAGLSYPLIGSQAIPMLDLISLNVSSFNAGTLTIGLSETGYTGPLDGVFQVAAGGTTTGSVNFQAYLDTSNTIFGSSTLLGGIGPLTGPAFSGVVALPVTVSSPAYSITLLSNITHAWWGGATSFDFESKLPEPASIILLGSGVILLGLIGWRRKGLQGS